MSKSSYAWIITKDCQPEPGYPEGTNANARGVIGPGLASDVQMAILRTALTDDRAPGMKKFRLCSDDKEVYYEGWFLGDPTSEDGFGPLDDFGAPNAGCTYIEYLENASWVQL